MNHEHAPHEPDQPEENSPGASPWDPREQVGDIYQVDTDSQGVTHAENLDIPVAAETDLDITHEENRRERPSIWVGSWLDYNNGVLHGDWIPADRDESEIWADIQTMLARSPTTASSGEVAEDWGIFDHDDFGPLRIGEQESVAWVSAVARGIAEHGPAFAAWADVMQNQEALDGFEDHYLGRYDSVQDYVEQMVGGDTEYQRLLDGALPDGLRSYVRFDTAALATDMQLGGDIHVLSAYDGGVWIFDAR